MFAELILVRTTAPYPQPGVVFRTKSRAITLRRSLLYSTEARIKETHQSVRQPQ